MFSLRQKIFFGYAIVFLVFLALLFPYATQSVRKIVRKTLEESTSALIAEIHKAPDEEALVALLELKEKQYLFRFTLYNPEQKPIYDSHIVMMPSELLEGEEEERLIPSAAAAEDAFATGKGYAEKYSRALEKKLAYLAKAFDFHGETYVIRAAFPFAYVAELTRNFEVGFLTLGVAVLLFFSLMTALIIHHLTGPIQHIIQTITPYQEGKSDKIPEIDVDLLPQDDVGKLARTLNSLSKRIEGQIRHLTTERNEKEAVLESLVEGVIAVDNTMTVTYMNHSAAEMLELDPDMVVGRKFMVTQQLAYHDLLLDCQRAGKALMMTVEPKGGEKLFLEVVAAPKGGKNGAVLVLEDKSSHYKVLEIGRDFIANASHELKTPITIIRGFAETLHSHNLPRKDVRNGTEKILRNCQRMEVLVRNLLVLADVDEGIPNSRLFDCDLYSMIKECKQLTQNLYPDVRINIIKPEGEELRCLADPDLLERAFLNLLDNAAKYSEGVAEVTATLSREGSQVQVEIADKGIGIPEEDLEGIFLRFYTVNKARSRRLGGAGLGLSITQTIIERHHGTIAVTSKLGHGSTFTITLPQASPEEIS